MVALIPWLIAISCSRATPQRQEPMTQYVVARTNSGASSSSGSSASVERLPILSFLVEAAHGHEKSGSYILQAQLSEPLSASARFPVDISGSAKVDEDFTIHPTDVSAFGLSFLAGETTASLTLQFIDDQLDEPIENIIIEILADSRVQLGTKNIFTFSIDPECAETESCSMAMQWDPSVQDSYQWNEDSPISLALAVINPYPTAATFSIDPLATTCTVGWQPALTIQAATGVFTGTPQNAAVGSCQVKVTASNTLESISKVIQFAVQNTDDEATWKSTVTRIEIESGIALTRDIGAQDMDVGDTIVYELDLSLCDLGDWDIMPSVSANGILSGTADALATGECVFTEFATSSGSQEPISREITIAYTSSTPPGSPPVWSNGGNFPLSYEFFEGVTNTITIVATDADDDAITYSLNSPQTTCSFSLPGSGPTVNTFADHGTIVAMPRQSDVGTQCTISVKATANGESTSNLVLTIQVRDTPQPPTIQFNLPAMFLGTPITGTGSPANRFLLSAEEGAGSDSLTFTLSDPDNTMPALQCSGLDVSISQNQATIFVSALPVGNHDFECYASDGVLQSNSLSFRLQISSGSVSCNYTAGSSSARNWHVGQPLTRPVSQELYASGVLQAAPAASGIFAAYNSKTGSYVHSLQIDQVSNSLAVNSRHTEQTANTDRFQIYGGPRVAASLNVADAYLTTFEAPGEFSVSRARRSGDPSPTASIAIESQLSFLFSRTNGEYVTVGMQDLDGQRGIKAFVNTNGNWGPPLPLGEDGFIQSSQDLSFAGDIAANNIMTVAYLAGDAGASAQSLKIREFSAANAWSASTIIDAHTNGAIRAFSQVHLDVSPNGNHKIVTWRAWDQSAGGGSGKYCIFARVFSSSQWQPVARVICNSVAGDFWVHDPVGAINDSGLAAVIARTGSGSAASTAIVYKIEHALFTGASFCSAGVLQASAGKGYPPQPQVVIDSSGRIVALWQEDDIAPSYQGQLKSAEFSGNSWSAVRTLDRNAAGSTVGASPIVFASKPTFHNLGLQPQLVMDGQGVPFVAWLVSISGVQPFVSVYK
jgi:hypothetical protein